MSSQVAGARSCAIVPKTVASVMHPAIQNHVLPEALLPKAVRMTGFDLDAQTVWSTGRTRPARSDQCFCGRPPVGISVSSSFASGVRPSRPRSRLKRAAPRHQIAA